MPENKLVVDAATTKYELELSPQTYPYFSGEAGQQDRLGIFTLQQPLTNSFGLTLNLVQMPGQQWTGNWLVANEAAPQLCGGSIDLLPPTDLSQLRLIFRRQANAGLAAERLARHWRDLKVVHV